ncbi:unnamed protein product [Effrenium voratum]|uniref:Uncharacterized protein n=1 Tax=Effrenium voratum TaxID=2562239 RepID=A0AA36HLR8_9DINO|nr:unnamed protein product [Effrenium voratum]
MGCCASSSKVVAHRSPHADESDRKPAKRDKPPCGKPPEAKQEAKDERKDEHEGTADQASCKETENRTEPPGMVHMEESSPGPSKRRRLVAQLPKIVPVAVSEKEIKQVFEEYLPHVPAELQRTVDCSWQHLVKEAKKAWDSCGELLQWFWLLHPEAEAREDAFGLVVLWLQRGATASHCVVSHLSFVEVGQPWHCLVPGALETLRLHLFNMPISTIRITLWYTPKDGKMVLDKDAEKPFKQAGYRWFQLANNSDGKRGQIMCQKRSQERDARPAPDIPDLCLSSCLLMPNRHQVQVVEEVRRQGSGNAAVLAECLRRHCEGCLQVLPDASPLSSMKEGKGLPLVRTSQSGEVNAWQDFAAECFKEIELPKELLAWFSRRESQEGESDRDALCGGLTIAVNWKAQRSDPSQNFSLVTVQATAQHQELAGQKPVAYLATEDDEISVMVCQLPSGKQYCLYEMACRLLKEAPPVAFDDRAVSQVRLPRLLHHCVASSEMHVRVGESLAAGSAEAAFDVAGAREIFGARLMSRTTPPGALAVDDPPTEQVLAFDGDFLLAVWHEKYMDLQASAPLPLFATRLSCM